MVTGQESLGEGQHMRWKEQQAGGVMGGRQQEKRGVLWLGLWWTCAWSVRTGLDKEEGELEQEGLGKG